MKFKNIFFYRTPRWLLLSFHRTSVNGCFCKLETQLGKLLLNIPCYWSLSTPHEYIKASVFLTFSVGIKRGQWYERVKVFLRQTIKWKNFSLSLWFNIVKTRVFVSPSNLPILVFTKNVSRKIKLSKVFYRGAIYPIRDLHKDEICLVIC